MKYWIALVLFALAACASPDDAGAPGDSSGSETDGGAANGPGIGELGGMCGGIAAFECTAEGSFCRSEAGACKEIADYAGTCVTKPEICTMEYDPVCGCDGKTYGNSCSAAAAGASIAFAGECESTE